MLAGHSSSARCVCTCRASWVELRQPEPPIQDPHVCFNARSESASAFRDAFSNRWLWAAVALSTALQAAVVHLPFLNLAFGTVPLSAGQWAVCVAMASGVLWFSEGRKWLRGLWARRSRSTPGQ